jgi:hypothetical protein
VRDGMAVRGAGQQRSKNQHVEGTVQQVVPSHGAYSTPYDSLVKQGLS